MDVDQRVVHRAATGVSRDVAAEIDGLMNHVSVTNIVPRRRWRRWCILRAFGVVACAIAEVPATRPAMTAMAEIARAARRRFSRSDIAENALIMPGHPLLEENTVGV